MKISLSACALQMGVLTVATNSHQFRMWTSLHILTVHCASINSIIDIFLQKVSFHYNYCSWIHVVFGVLSYTHNIVLPFTSNDVYLFSFTFRMTLRGKQKKVNSLDTYSMKWLLYNYRLYTIVQCGIMYTISINPQIEHVIIIPYLQ